MIRKAGFIRPHKFLVWLFSSDFGEKFAETFAAVWPGGEKGVEFGSFGTGQQ